MMHPLCLLYCWGKSTQHQLGERLGGPQSQSHHCGEEKNAFPLEEVEL